MELFKNFKMTTSRALRLFVFGGIILMLFWGYSRTADADADAYVVLGFEPTTTGWVQILDGESIVLDDIADYIPTETGQGLVIERTVDEEMLCNSLVFFAEQQEVVITIDDQVVYELFCPDYLEFFGSPGCKWVNLYISEDMVGKTLRIYLTNDYTMYQDMPTELYFIGESSISLLQFNRLFTRNIAVLVIFGLALITYLNAFMWKEKTKRRYLFCLADLYLFAGLWLCFELNLLAVYLGRAELSAFFSMIFLRIMPIVFFHFCLSMMKQRTAFTVLSGICVWANLIFSILLQFIWGVSLIDLLWCNFIIGTYVCIRAIYVIIRQYRSRHQHDMMDHAFYASLIFVVAYAIESYWYMSANNYYVYTGFAMSIAFLAYSMIAHVLLVNAESKTDQAKRALEEEYTRLHKKPLNQQINAHFMFNSLNTISAYCKEDPAKADYAVRVLANYMHSYAMLVGSDEYVAVEEELDLLESYMTIQNVRFENHIVFTVNNQCEEVMIPPLVLQTLVENAIHHGLRNQYYVGEISIDIKDNLDMFEIIVKDSGVGFDVSKLKKAEGVGIRNLNHRVLAMGGTVTVTSEVGQGTTVSLLIPKQTKPMGE